MNFDDVLKTKTSDIERPPLVPVGNYRVAVAKVPEFQEISSKNWEGNTVNFQLQLIEPQSDVDEDALREFGSLKSTQIRHSFMFPKDDKQGTERAAYNMKRFLIEHLRIEDADNMEMKQLIAAAQGRQCLAEIGLRPDKEDKETFYNTVKKTAPLE